jgi:hypothetical protein
MDEPFKKGERVKHATKTEWGIGEVLANESGGKVPVFFEDVGAKEFDLAHAKFVRLPGVDGASGYLTALVKHHHAEAAKPAPIAGKKKPEFMSFAKAVQNFLSYFPSGFKDPEYLDGARSQRKFKFDAHLLMIDLLGNTTFSALLDQADFKEIYDRAKRVINKTILISPYEKIWFSNGVAVEANQKRFAESLYDLLYGESGLQLRFERYAEMLSAIGAAKWPIATYFLFITFPENQMFLKPVVTQDAARVLNQEINYRPELNWLTYSQVLALAERIRKELLKDGREMLIPRDMIDVQSFIWVSAPGYF